MARVLYGMGGGCYCRVVRERRYEMKFTQLSNKTAKNTGTDAVFRQLLAYNHGEIELFCAQFSDDIEVFTLDGECLMRGKAAFRQSYSKLFSDYPHLHCELVHRIRHPGVVIDEEHVKRTPDGETIHATAIYQLKNDLIVRVTFVR